MEQKSFIFYKSFFDSIQRLPDEWKLEMFQAVCEFAFSGKRREFDDPIKEAIFIVMEPLISENIRRLENSRKGGRPRKENISSEPIEPSLSNKEPIGFKMKTENEGKNNIK